jgi:hypothetical protein
MMNIRDWIRERSFLQPHKKALIFEEPPKPASGKIQKFTLKETHRITKFQAPNRKLLGHSSLNDLITQ